jgi:hypothetical protein
LIGEAFQPIALVRDEIHLKWGGFADPTFGHELWS